MQFVRSNQDGPAYVPFGQQMVKIMPARRPGADPGDRDVVNAIDDDVLKKLTGGFRGNGQPKGGPAAPYFMGPRPEMQRVPEPVPGDPVHKVKVSVGVTKSRRRLRLEAKQDRDDLLLEELRASRESQAELTRELIAMKGGRPAAKAEPLLDPGEHTVADLTDLLEGLSAAELVEVLGLEVGNKNRRTAVEAITEAITA